MNQIEDRIRNFIGEHHIFTLAVTTDSGPWCATCFYVYHESLNILIFTSDPDTKHIEDIVRRNDYWVAGAIALETKMIGKIRGIQFTGRMRLLEGMELKVAKKIYLEKFPIARLSRLYLWGLQPEYIKMTDNRLGFGKKLIWKGLGEL